MDHSRETTRLDSLACFKLRFTIEPASRAGQDRTKGFSTYEGRPEKVRLDNGLRGRRLVGRLRRLRERAHSNRPFAKWHRSVLRRHESRTHQRLCPRRRLGEFEISVAPGKGPCHRAI